MKMKRLRSARISSIELSCAPQLSVLLLLRSVTQRGVSPGDHRTSLRRLSRTSSAHSVVVGVFGVVGVVGQLGMRMAVISVCAVVFSLLNVCYMFICEAYVCSLHVPREILASFCSNRFARESTWLVECAGAPMLDDLRS